MKYFIVSIICISILLSLMYSQQNKWFYLFLNQQKTIQEMYFPNEIQLPDPTMISETIYGKLTLPYGVVSYFFIPHHKATISLETLVPIRPSNQFFRPAWEIIGPNIAPQPMNIEFSVPTNTNDIGHDYIVPKGKRSIVFDTASVSLLSTGNQQHITVLPGKTYYLNIYEPLHYTGDYVVRITHDDQQLLPQIIPILYVMTGWDRIDKDVLLNTLGLCLLFLSISFGFGLAITSLLMRKVSTKIYLTQAGNFGVCVLGLFCLEKITYNLLFCVLQYLLCIGGVILCLAAKSSHKQSVLKILLCIWIAELLTTVWYLCVLR